jgi:hypothetical protein
MLWRRASAGFLALVMLTVIVGAAATPAPAHAQAGGTVILGSVPDERRSIGDKILDSLIVSGLTATMNAANYFLTSMAHSIASAIVGDCPDGPCFGTKFWRQSIREAGEGAAAHAIIAIAEGSGLEKLGIDVCNPDISLGAQLQIALGYMKELSPTPPRCTLNQIGQNWDSFVDSVATGEAFNLMAPIFVPGDAPISFHLETMAALEETRAAAEAEAKLAKLGEMVNGGFSSVLDPVSQRIVSPAAVIQEEYRYMRQLEQQGLEASRAQMIGSAASRSVAGLVTNTVSVFAQTLVAKSWNKLIGGLLTAEQAVSQQPDLVLDFEATLNPTAGSTDNLRPQFNNPVPTRVSNYNPIEEFMTCNQEYRAGNNCVVDERFATAIEIGRTEGLTVRQAIERGYLNGDWPLVSSENRERDQSWDCYQSGYCESNLKKLRAARVVPIGWEIAAGKSPVNNPYTLRRVMNGFYDCNAEGVGDKEHPFCHLIDPDWVLKVPATQCLAMGYGPHLLSPDIPTRHDECVDSVTCLKEDALGNCVGGWGYCTKERNIWHFNGDECPSYYNSCRTLKAASTGQTKNLLVNTMERGICNADNAGCRAYATEPNAVRCTQSALCNDLNGCPCRLPITSADRCRVVYNDSTCTAPTGEICALPSGLCGEAGGCDCETSRQCRIAQGQSSCTSASGDYSTVSDDWKTGSMLYANRRVETCSGENDGCSALFTLAAGQSLNLVRNGSFEQVEAVSDLFNVAQRPAGWMPQAASQNLSTGRLDTFGNAATHGQNAAEAGDAATCSLTQNCAVAGGCPCVRTGSLKTLDVSVTSYEYACVVAYGARTCEMNLHQNGIPFTANKTYTVSATTFALAGVNAGKMRLSFFDHAGNPIYVPADAAVPGDLLQWSSQDGREFSLQRPTAADLANDSCARSGDGTVYFEWDADAGVSFTRYSCDFVVSSDLPIATARLSLLAGNGSTDRIWFDSVQLEQGPRTNFHENYNGQTGVVYAKVAPTSLNCRGEDDDPPECAAYALACRESEVGCNVYTPADGSTPVTGIVNANDRCPAACVGYDTYRRQPTAFDPTSEFVHFIPRTATQCSESQVGCSEFTNIQTEALAYYQELKFCVSPGTDNTDVFYTWEGSDTVGYQLKTWRFKTTEAPVGEGTVCCAGGQCSAAMCDVGGASPADACATPGNCVQNYAPCTALAGSNSDQCASVSSANAGGSTLGLCSASDIAAGDSDCREFYDAEGNRHFRRLSSVIHVSETCQQFRLAGIGREQCEDMTGGTWNDRFQACVYRFDTAASRSCQAQFAGCRAYRGNQAGNTRFVADDDFELEGDGLTGWVTGTRLINQRPRDAIALSSEAITVGGHSLRTSVTGLTDQGQWSTVALRDLGYLKQSHTYTASMWVRGQAGTRLSLSFTSGSELTCELGSTCGDASCTCTDRRTGTSCAVGTGADSCVVSGITGAVPDFKPVVLGEEQLTSTEWQLVRFGPVVLPTDYPYDRVNNALMVYALTGSSDSTGTRRPIFIDNVTVEESQGLTYVVDESWDTPRECDQTGAGLSSPQEMLGCREYRDMDSQAAYLRSFDQLCRERAAGCGAYSHTRNTVDQPHSTTYNARCVLRDMAPGDSYLQRQVCGGPARCYLTQACQESGGCECATRVDDNEETMTCTVGLNGTSCALPVRETDNQVNCSCDYYSSRGLVEDVCTVSAGTTSCSFEFDGYAETTPASEAPDRRIVPSDERMYLVTRNHRCDAANMSCRVVAEPQYAYEATCTLPPKPASVPGPTSGGVDSRGVCVTGDCTCTVADQLSGEVYGSCLVQRGNRTCAAPLSKPVVSDWREVGLKDNPNRYEDILCTDQALMCEEFSATDVVYYLKDPGNRVCEYREDVLIDGELRSGYFRLSSTGADIPCYPALLRDQARYDLYRNSDQFCQLSAGDGGADGNGVCALATGCPCSVNGQVACLVSAGYTNCGYDGWVGQCESAYDRCEEFVDRMATSEANPDGTPYYYLVNSRLDMASCQGASLRQGCVLLDRTSNPLKAYSAPTTYLVSGQNDNDVVAPANCEGSNPHPACDMRCARVTDGRCSFVQSKYNPCRTNGDCAGNGVCGADNRCTEPQQIATACTKDSDCVERPGCRVNADCGAGGTCAADGKCNLIQANTCVGPLSFTVACNGANDCNTAIGERCLPVAGYENASPYCAEEIGLSGSFRPGNDSNVVVRARLDRECSEWLTCTSESRTWDEASGEEKAICDSFALCSKIGADGEECVEVATSPRQQLTEEDYAKRDISWYGEDRSGYSLFGRYPLEYVSPVFIPQKACYISSTRDYQKANGYLVTCRSDDACGAGASCVAMEGICRSRDGYLEDRPCSINDHCNVGLGEYCAKSYLDTHRFGVVFDRAVYCVPDGDGQPGDTSCLPSDFGLAEDAGLGSCRSGTCVWDYAGGPFQANELSHGACRAYPESNAPFSAEVVHPSPSPDGSPFQNGYDRFGFAVSKKEQFAEANVCAVANNCECSYTKITYGNSAMTRFYSYPGEGSQPISYNDLDASKFYNAYEYSGICEGGPYQGKRCDPAVNLIEREGDGLTAEEMQVAGCGDEGTCRPWTSVQYYRGWTGYCVDYDFSRTINGTRDSFACNLWLPVNQLSGAPDIVNQFREAGFNPSETKLMYCTVAQGNAQASSGGLENEFFDLGDDAINLQGWSYGPFQLGGNPEVGTAGAGGAWGATTRPRKTMCCRLDEDGYKGDGYTCLYHSGQSFEDFNGERFLVRSFNDIDEGGTLRENQVVAIRVEVTPGPRPATPQTPDTIFINGQPYVEVPVEDNFEELQREFGLELVPREGRYYLPYQLAVGEFEDGQADEIDSQMRVFYLSPANDWTYSNSLKGLLPGVVDYTEGDVQFQSPYHDTRGASTEAERLLRAGAKCACAQPWWGDVSFDVRIPAFKSGGTGVLDSLEVAYCDGNDRNTGINIKYYPIFRENCTEVQVVHDISKSEAASFPSVAWTDRLYRGLLGDPGAGIGNLSWNDGQDFATTRTGGHFGGGTSIFPYGHVTTGVNEGVEGDVWRIDLNHPLPIWDGEYGSPYSWLGNKDTGDQSMEYPDDIPNAEVGGIPVSAKGLLGRSETLDNPYPSSQNIGEGAYAAARSALGNLFVKSWRTYTWSPEEDAKFETGYARSDAAVPAALDPNASDPAQLKGSAYDFRASFATVTNAPSVVAPDFEGETCSSADPLICRETVRDDAPSISGSLAVNYTSTEDVLVNSGASLPIQFYAYADENHLPIRRLSIDYGDGQVKSTQGWFRNHRGCPFDIGDNCSEEVAVCQNDQPNDSLGVQPRSCDAGYFAVDHIYQCPDEYWEALPVCDGQVYPCKEEAGLNDLDYCQFKPRVQVMDNWGVCNGSCPGGAGSGNVCLNTQLAMEPTALNPFDPASTLATDECIALGAGTPYRLLVNGSYVQPWNEFPQVIRVTKASIFQLDEEAIPPQCLINQP